MNMVRRLIAAFSAATVIAGSVNLGAFAIGSEPEIVEFEMIAEVSDTGYGYLPSKLVDENGNEIEQELMPESTGNYANALPAKYSMLDYNYVPAIRDQGTEGSCWAHAGMAMAETNMIKSGLAKQSVVDLSEKHLAWFAIGANPSSTDPLYNDIVAYGTDAYSKGGNSYDIMYTLFAWMGVELESRVPYRDFTSGVSESYRYDSYGHVQNVNQYDPSDMTSIKTAIMNDGAVSVGFLADNSYVTTSNNANFTAYYRPNTTSTNHEIVIVGWDDNFSKSNFAHGTPSSDGAWLCRNSWGADWGTNGYFYMSYEEPELSDFTSVQVEPKTNYNRIYQRDGGTVHSGNYVYMFKGYSSTNFQGSANIFTAAASENLAAVSFYAYQANAKYQIKIYNNITSTNLSSLTPVYTQSGTETYAGYHTIKLNKQIPLTAGNKFAVLVDVWDDSGTHYIFTDRNINSTGESVAIVSGSTVDLYSQGAGNPRIKAYTAGTVSAPTNVKASAGDSKVQVKWDAVTGATSYRVMVWDGTKWTGYSTTATSYMVRNLTNGKKYAFAVKTCANGTYSDTSTTVYATPFNPVPQNVKAGAGDSKVQVKWDAVPTATSYRIMVWDGTSWTGYSTTATSYMVRDLTNGKKYAFAVKSYVNGAYSETSTTVYATPYSTIPQNVKAGAGDGKVQVKWDAVTGATSYRVMVWDGTSWTGYSTTATSYMVRDLTNGKKYAFAVKAYVGGAYSDTSTIVYATPFNPIPQNVKAGAGDSKVQVKWDAVTGATSYRVMVWDGTSWTGYSTTATSYMVRNLTNGKKYAFAVKAYVNGAYSDVSATVYATPNA